MNEQEILNCVPVKNDDAFAFTREELNGKMMFISSKHPELKELTMNRTAIYIFDNCTGKATISNICEAVMQRYNSEALISIQGDTISTLVNFWRLGLIHWKGLTPYDYMFSESIEGDVFKLLSEDEVIAKMHLFNNKCYFDPTKDESFAYSESALRQKVFSNIEVFFEVTNDESQKLLMSFLPDYNKMSLQIGYLFIDDRIIDLSIAEKFLTWCSSCLSRLSNNSWSNSFQKIRIFLLPEYVEVTKKIQLIGFKNIGNLKGEFEDSNQVLQIYDYNF